ncbi:hypothetical protein EC968_007111 [Mortierella alpina]|nr:hypothetical protein EC968_007111 [Mortierella alpina]
MGVQGTWPFLRKKGYQPVLRHQTALMSSQSSPPPSPCVLHVDILGCFFLTVRTAYTSCSWTVAHGIVERQIQKFGEKKDIVLYIDGGPAQEKASTTAVREDRRRKALESADLKFQSLENRITEGLRVRKHHFKDVSKDLRSAFYWTLDARRAFANYMLEHGWTVVQCATEADLTIAQTCKSADIVVSRDSDMLYYASVRTIWRPISKGRILVYDVNGVMATLGINQAQLTVLGVVSHNDYNRSIPSLGSVSNYGIVKELTEQDPKALLGKYLGHERVMIKNTNQENFDASRRPQRKFQALSDMYSLRQEELRKTRQAEKSASTDVVERLQGSRSNSIRYGTVDRPQMHEASSISEGQPALPRTRIPPHKRRYSFKKRTPRKEHLAPAAMIQYTWKPWTKAPENPLISNSKASAKKKKKKKKELKPITSTTGKRDLLFAMVREHPTVTLDLGTLQANVQRSPVESDLEPHIMQCLQDITQTAAHIKRSGQKLLGLFIEAAFVSPKPSDRMLLDYLCPRVSSKVDSDEQDEDEREQAEEDPEFTNSEHVQFFHVLLNYLYNDHPIKTETKVGERVQRFIDRAQEYRFGKPAQTMQKNKVLSVPSRIDENKSAIENYIALNNSTRSLRRTFPLSGIEQPFVTISETDLTALLWQNDNIKAKLQSLALEDFEDKTVTPSQVDIAYWLQRKPPGFLLSALLSDVGLSAPRKGRRNYKDRTSLMSLDEMQIHLQHIRKPGFDANRYKKKDYVLRGSIKTDGFRLQVLAFKLSELSAVKYKQLPPDHMPRRITSTLGGLGDYLTEIRNVIKTPQDVADIFECPPEQDSWN